MIALNLSFMNLFHNHLEVYSLLKCVCTITSVLVVRSFPFQLNEKGWGEFEVLIKIFFVDPTEKPCILHHFLRLYPMEDPFMIRHPILPPENTVITEQYDEIVHIY